MDMETSRLLAEIKAFLSTHDMKATYFGQQAANNCALVKRLEAGGTVTLPTAMRIRVYMSDPEERVRAYQTYLARVRGGKKNGKSAK